MTIGNIANADLEDWLRQRYFAAEIDISSSGVENYRLGQLRRMLGIPAAALDRLIFRDSPSTGSAALRAAIAARYAPGAADQVMVTHGSTEAIFLGASALVEPGDEVIVMRPVYQSLSSIAQALGANLRVWDVTGDTRPDLTRLRSLINRRTRSAILNFPHNPTGTTLDLDEFHHLVEIFDHHGVFLVWDGCLSDLVYDAPALPDPTTLLERCMSVGSLSKAYGLPGLRVGWSIAPPALQQRMVRLRDYTSINTSPLCELIATEVLNAADRVIRPRLEQASANRGLFARWLEETRPLARCAIPGGGVTAFPAFPDIPDVRPLCEDLADRDGVLVVPGDCFGYPSRMRIGFGGPSDQFAAGLRKLAATAATNLHRTESRGHRPARASTVHGERSARPPEAASAAYAGTEMSRTLPRHGREEESRR